MLIANAVHLNLAGAASLEEPCPYCSRPLAVYPLLMSDDPQQTVYQKPRHGGWLFRDFDDPGKIQLAC